MNRNLFTLVLFTSILGSFSAQARTQGDVLAVGECTVYKTYTTDNWAYLGLLSSGSYNSFSLVHTECVRKNGSVARMAFKEKFEIGFFQDNDNPNTTENLKAECEARRTELNMLKISNPECR